MKGRVKAIKREKFFGFITDETGQDRFFHSNCMDVGDFDQLQEGHVVDFEPYEEAGKGPEGRPGQRARLVRIVA